MCSQTGFSLLEMMLVVLILSTLAFSAIDIVDNKDNQVRFEDTRRRLDLIRRAVIGETGAVYNGQRLLSGYAADNGLLPKNDDPTKDDQGILALLSKPSNYDSYSLKSPIFDPKPAATGINDGPAPTEVVLSEPEEKLFKGYRSGSYLTPPPSSAAPAFYDGWNAGASPNFGWNWTVTGTPEILTVTSLGADGGVGGTGIYDADIGITVTDDDWRVDVDGWAVTVQNKSTFDLAVSAPGCVRASLLVYLNSNDATDPNPFSWKRLTSECIPGALAAGSNVDVLFPAAGGFQPSTRIPAGEHLLVLVVDKDPTPHNGSPGETPCKDGVVAGPPPKIDCETTGNRITTKVTFFPRVALPTDKELVIR